MTNVKFGSRASILRELGRNGAPRDQDNFSSFSLYEIGGEEGRVNRAEFSCFSLQSGNMTAEEFHSSLQEATNYRLRGFVLPYLKHTLPALQRDLSNAARSSNQVSIRYQIRVL